MAGRCTGVACTIHAFMPIFSRSGAQEGGYMHDMILVKILVYV